MQYSTEYLPSVRFHASVSLCSWWRSHWEVADSGHPVRVRYQWSHTEANRVNDRHSAFLDFSDNVSSLRWSLLQSLVYNIKNALISTISDNSSGRSLNFFCSNNITSLGILQLYTACGCGSPVQSCIRASNWYQNKWPQRLRWPWTAIIMCAFNFRTCAWKSDLLWHRALSLLYSTAFLSEYAQPGLGSDKNNSHYLLYLLLLSSVTYALLCKYELF